MMPLTDIKQLIKNCLDSLYSKDHILFESNNSKGLCERCIVFRFAHYLQNNLDGLDNNNNRYFVDCDFNSSIVGGRPTNSKQITNPDGTSTGRFVDIIVHKRFTEQHNGFICFEIKKWNNCRSKDMQKDKNNLRALTSEYDYQYGFNLILGKTKNKTKWQIFHNGQSSENIQLVFSDQGQNE